MTITEFKNYQTIADKIIDLLIKENHSSIRDIKIIYNIIMGFTYCLDQEGHYTYHSRFYNSISELPDEAKKDIICQAHQLKYSSVFSDNDLLQIRKP